MTMTRQEFEEQFDSRTLAYLPGFVRAAQPLVIVIGPTAHSAAGHALLVSLANQVARAHRRIVFVGDLDRPLLCSDFFGMGSLTQATAGLASAINPFIEIDVAEVAPRSEALLTIGVGADVDVELGLGCDGWVAVLGSQTSVGTDQTSIWGALLASCLGANTALHRILENRQLPGGPFSLWDYAQNSLVQGPSIAGPIDIGRVLQVGAGAVGCGLDFFLSFFGIGGAWTIVDGDAVEVSNLNRQLLFITKDAGFPEGEPCNKAKRAAQLLGDAASFSPAWFHKDADVVDGQYDLVLALANDYGVRSALQHRQPTVLLHSTTSRSWQAQLHRHIAGRDDCIDCRLPPDTPRFTCSAEDVEAPTGEHFDAAIPPLSAMAGLLLSAELVRLQEGRLLHTSHNFTAVELSTGVPIVQRKLRSCREGCAVRRPAALRAAIDAHSRWLHLDGDQPAGSALPR